MPYLGPPPSQTFVSVSYQDLTGGSGTGFTLDYPVSSANEIEVFVNNVRQEPGVAYTVAGTTLTMTGSIVSTDDFYVVFQGKAIGTIGHPAGNDLQAVNGTFTGNVNINGNELILDADADTKLYASTDDVVKMNIAGSEMFRFDSDGLKFNGDTAAANALDDYEEGTWTPTDGSPAGLSFTVLTANYTKIGNTVTIHCYLSYPSTSNTSVASIDGLPFGANVSNQYPQLTMRIANNTVTRGNITFQVAANSTKGTLYNGGSSVSNNEVSNTSVLISGSYEVS